MFKEIRMKKQNDLEPSDRRRVSRITDSLLDDSNFKTSLTKNSSTNIYQASN